MTDTLSLKIIYDREGDRAKSEAERRGYVFCGSGCSTCCTLPMVANSGDVALLREGIRRLSPEALVALRDRARAYLPELKSAARSAIRTRPESVLPVLAMVWPKQGAPCPALDGGNCVVYGHRPLACRMHYARMGDPADLRVAGPCVTGKPIATMDARGAIARIGESNKLRSVGLVGLEIAALVEEAMQ